MSPVVKRLRVAMGAARADLVTPGRRVPRGVRPFDAGVIAQCWYPHVTVAVIASAESQ